MFNIKKTVSSLAGLVGFEQRKDLAIPALDDALLISRSGKLFNKGVHELVNLENIFLTCPDFSRYNTTQTEGELFNEHLSGMVDSAITNVLHGLVNKKKLYTLTKDTLTQTKLYDGVGRLADKIIAHNRFVGFQIETKEGRLGVLPIIRRIMIQVTDQNPNLKFYIYHPEQAEPLMVVNAGSLTPQNGFSAVNVLMLENILMDTAFTSYDKLIVGYYEEDLTGQAVNKDTDLSKAPCGSCNRTNNLMYWSWANNIAIHPFEVASDDIDSTGRTQFRSTDMQFKYTTNWGLNLEIAINCEISEFLIQNQNSLAAPVADQFAVLALEQIMNSTRENSVSEKTKQLAYTALDGGENSPGMYKKLDQALENLSFDFSGFDSPCLPCNTKTGVKYTSVF